MLFNKNLLKKWWDKMKMLKVHILEATVETDLTDF